MTTRDTKIVNLDLSRRKRHYLDQDHLLRRGGAGRSVSPFSRPSRCAAPTATKPVSRSGLAAGRLADGAICSKGTYHALKHQWTVFGDRVVRIGGPLLSERTQSCLFCRDESTSCATSVSNEIQD